MITSVMTYSCSVDWAIVSRGMMYLFTEKQVTLVSRSMNYLFTEKYVTLIIIMYDVFIHREIGHIN